MLFLKNRICILCSASKGEWCYVAAWSISSAYASVAKILSQIKNAGAPVDIDIFVQAKAKDPPTDALPRFLEAYTSGKRVGTLTKEARSGKLVDEWNKTLEAAEHKPAISDVTPAVSSFMTVKDEEELVRLVYGFRMHIH